jgi:putative ABC transport system permease protein
MGMYGLSLFSAERRKKEVGIRKVNGAHAGQILQLFIKDFAVVVLIANALALPVGVFIMDRWLRNFAYHVGVEWWILLASLFVSVGVAVLTVSYTTVKAANTNPALILRDE